MPQERVQTRNSDAHNHPIPISSRALPVGSSSVLFRQNPIYHPFYRNTQISSWDRARKCSSEQGQILLCKRKHERSEIKGNGSQGHRNQFLYLPIVFLDTEQRMVPHLWHERHPRGAPISQVWIHRQSWYNNPSEQADHKCLFPPWARVPKRAPALIKMWSHCCCEVTSVVSDSVWPHRWQPTRLLRPGIFQARVLEWVARALLPSKGKAGTATSSPQLQFCSYLFPRRPLRWEGPWQGCCGVTAGPGLRMDSSLGREILWKHWLSTSSILPFTHSPIYQLIHPRIHLPIHLFIYPQMFAEGLTALRTLWKCSGSLKDSGRIRDDKIACWSVTW